MVEEEGHSALRRVYSWWNWIWNDPVRNDPSRLPIVPPSGPALPPPSSAEGIFTDEFYAQIAARVPLKFAALSRYLGAPVTPVLDLLATGGLGLQGGMDSVFASKMYVNFIPADGFPPIVAGGVAGFVKTISCRNPIGSGKRIFPFAASLDAAAQFQGWRRHNSALATPLASNLQPNRVTDGVTGSCARFTAEQIANAAFPGGGPAVFPANNLFNWPSSNTFQSASPTLIPLCWLKEGEGLITFKTAIFGNPVDGGGMSHLNWIILEE